MLISSMSNQRHCTAYVLLNPICVAHQCCGHFHAMLTLTLCGSFHRPGAQRSPLGMRRLGIQHLAASLSNVRKVRSATNLKHTICLCRVHRAKPIASSVLISAIPPRSCPLTASALTLAHTVSRNANTAAVDVDEEVIHLLYCVMSYCLPGSGSRCFCLRCRRLASLAYSLQSLSGIGHCLCFIRIPAYICFLPSIGFISCWS